MGAADGDAETHEIKNSRLDGTQAGRYNKDNRGRRNKRGARGFTVKLYSNSTVTSDPSGSLCIFTSSVTARQLPACQKSPYRTFLTALSAGHFESVQNAVTESLVFYQSELLLKGKPWNSQTDSALRIAAHFFVMFIVLCILFYVNYFMLIILCRLCSVFYFMYIFLCLL